MALSGGTQWKTVEPLGCPMHFVSAITLTQLSSDPSLVGAASATTPLPVDELMSIVRRVVQPLDIAHVGNQ